MSKKNSKILRNKVAQQIIDGTLTRAEAAKQHNVSYGATVKWVSAFKLQSKLDKAKDLPSKASLRAARASKNVEEPIIAAKNEALKSAFDRKAFVAYMDKRFERPKEVVAGQTTATLILEREIVPIIEFDGYAVLKSQGLVQFINEVTSTQKKNHQLRNSIDRHADIIDLLFDKLKEKSTTN